MAESRRTRVLVVSYDKVGPRMAGPAIRAYELARALAREHEVLLACRHHPEREGDGFEVRGYYKDNAVLAEMVEWCEVVLAFGFVLLENPAIVESGKFVIADVYDPFTLEVLVQFRDEPLDVQIREHHGALAGMNRQLQLADLFLVASERQRDLVFGMLAALNRVNPANYGADPTFERLITVVPFGLPSDEPRSDTRVLRGVHPGFGEDDLILLWAGGIYEWFDPLSLIRGVAELGQEEVKVFFMGMAHPNPEVPVMPMGARALALAEQLGVKDRLVFFNEGDWIPYDDRVGYLLEGDVGVSTHFRHVETAYAFRTRMLDYIWASVPILCTEGDTLADLVERRDLGEVVPAEDPTAIAKAIERLLDVDRRRQCASHLAELADELRWDRVVRPILEFCREPRHAPDRTDGAVPRTPEAEHLALLLAAKDLELQDVHREIRAMRTESEGLLREIDALTAFRERVQGSLPYRTLQRLRRGAGNGRV